MSSAINAAEAILVCSAFFTGEEPAASASGLEALERRSESSGDDGVEADGSADLEVPGVTTADTNDRLLSSFTQTHPQQTHSHAAPKCAE